MNTNRYGTPAARTMVLGFLALTAAAIALAFASRAGVVDPPLARRGIGMVIGGMFAVAGNFLPKMRPLNTGGDPAAITNSERGAGWALVLVGVADIGLFLFANLDRARSISSILGITALGIIAANWAWLARGMLFGRNRGADPSDSTQRGAPEQRRVMAWLLFAIFYLAVTACIKAFASDPGTTDKAGAWMLITFSILFAFMGYRSGNRISCSKQGPDSAGQSHVDDKAGI